MRFLSNFLIAVGLTLMIRFPFGADLRESLAYVVGGVTLLAGLEWMARQQARQVRAERKEGGIR